MRVTKLLWAAVVALPLASGCSLFRLGPRYRPEQVENESARLERFFEECFLTRLDRDPELRSRLGIKTGYGKWTDISEAHRREGLEITRENLRRIRSEFDPDDLPPDARLSYQLFVYECAREIEAFEWRLYDYPVNQMHGLQSEVPAFLITVHRIDTVADARSYVERLRGIGPLLRELARGLGERARVGILPPRFVFPKAIDDCHNLLVGAPFDGSGDDSTLLADFRSKLDALGGLASAEREELIESARDALRTVVQPAYEDLALTLQRLERRATDDDGVWRFENGDAFYKFALRRATTTEMSAAEIHDLGLSEISRIHGEMRRLMSRIYFEGDLEEFFAFLREDRRFYEANDDAGRAAYLRDARATIAAMDERLPELFLTFPRAPLEVKAVEAYRQESAGKAFYEQGTPDGSRPGTYFVNLHDMRDMPRYQMEALAYHEGIPGHHMQISIAQELESLPRFRRQGTYPAYVEGWALYSEWIPRQLGFYEDPYSDFGRLAMELWRACRLVVDTGIHSKRWTRQEAIDYLLENTPNPRGDCVKAVERYIVMPGQATAYKIGMLRIQELQVRSEHLLGDRYDIRDFHDLVLRCGPVPLAILEQVVEDWIEAESP